MNVRLVTKTIGVGKYEGLTSEEIISAIARHGIIKEDNGKLIKYLGEKAVEISDLNEAYYFTIYTAYLNTFEKALEIIF